MGTESVYAPTARRMVRAISRPARSSPRAAAAAVLSAALTKGQNLDLAVPINTGKTMDQTSYLSLTEVSGASQEAALSLSQTSVTLTCSGDWTCFQGTIDNPYTDRKRGGANAPPLSVSKKSRRVRRPQAANGDKSCSAATCAWRNILLRLSVCEVYAKGVHLVRAPDCKPFVENPQRGFSTVSEAEHWPSLRLFIWSYSWVYR